MTQVIAEKPKEAERANLVAQAKAPKSRFRHDG